MPRAKSFQKIKHTRRLSNPKGQNAHGACRVKQILKHLQRILAGRISWVALTRRQPTDLGE